MNQPLDPSALEALVGRVAGEFTERLQRGEPVDVEEYVRRYPDLAELLRAVLPSLGLLGPAVREPAGVSPSAKESDGPGDQPPLPERLGEYRLLREVGRGGMGIVYEAEQESLGRRVALKVLPAGIGLRPHLLERFRRETRAAARLHHTNIVPVFAVGEEGGVHYYAMQLIRGRGLDRVLRELRGEAGEGETGGLPSTLSLAEGLRNGRAEGVPGSAAGPPAPEDRSRGREYFRSVAGIIAQAADALAHAHAQGVLHRDVKPANLLLDAQGTVWLTDFGLARADDMEELTATGDLVGTLRYLAPERFRGQADARSDLYALGLILYELLTLRPAHDATGREALVQQVLQAEPVRPRLLEPAVPRDLETIALHCLHREPQRRYAAAQELADDLRRFQGGEPVRAKAVGLVGRGLLWARRRPALAGLLLLVGLLAMLTTGALVVLGVREWYSRQLESARDAAVQAREQAETDRDRKQQAVYLTRILLAQREWRENNVARARDLLGLCPEPLRNWEWHYLNTLCHGDVRTLGGGSAPVHGLAVSPDGGLLAAGDAVGLVRVWDAATGRELQSIPGKGHSVWNLAFRPDGKYLAWAVTDGTVHVWDLAAGREVLVFEALKGALLALAFSPDGKHLATAGFGPVRIWDAATGREVRALTGPDDFSSAVAYSPDGKHLAAPLADGSVRLWVATTGQLLHTLPDEHGHRAVLSFSPTDKRLASAGMDGSVKVWNTATGKLAFTLQGHAGEIGGVRYSPDGKRLATAGQDRTVRVWDAVTGRPLWVYQGHVHLVNGVAWFPDGTRLVSCGHDRDVKVWDATVHPEVRSLRPAQLRPGPKGGDARGVAFSPDGRRLAAPWGDRTLRVWDTGTWKEVLRADCDDCQFICAAWSPDGARLAAGTDRTVEVRDAASGRRLLALTGHTGTITSVAFSPDGVRLASASRDKTVKVWALATGSEERALRGHERDVEAVAFSPDGRTLASGGLDGTIRLWRADTGEPLASLRCPEGSPILTLAFNHDGTRLASAGTDDANSLNHTVRVWDVVSGREEHILRGHTGLVNSVAFAPDGRRLASASWDVTVKVWDLMLGEEILRLPVRSTNLRLAFSPDSTRLAAADGSEVLIWEARPPGPPPSAR
jgi:WD40 repeat protein/serine/threonine protein kinase